MIREIRNLEEMKDYAAEFAAKVAAKDAAKDAADGAPRSRHLFLLDGPMGAGKTQFTRFFLEALGSRETASPSFAIHNAYTTPHGGVDHVDLCRLETIDDLESTGFWDLFHQSDGIVLIEWSDRLKNWGVFAQLPRNWIRYKLRFEIPDREENPDGNARRVLQQMSLNKSRSPDGR